MFYVEAPNQAPFGRRYEERQVFMAGGITGCPDWQREMRDLLVNADATFYNPRRANFPIHDPDAARAQIEWEYKYLNQSDAILFWFPAETLCPIVLFELGAHAYDAETIYSHGISKVEYKPLFVGVHPDYQRKQDVEIQLALKRPEIEIVSSLEELATQVKTWCEPK